MEKTMTTTKPLNYAIFVAGLGMNFLLPAMHVEIKPMVHLKLIDKDEIGGFILGHRNKVFTLIGTIKAVPTWDGVSGDQEIVFVDQDPSISTGAYINEDLPGMNFIERADYHIDELAQFGGKLQSNDPVDLKAAVANFPTMPPARLEWDFCRNYRNIGAPLSRTLKYVRECKALGHSDKEIMHMAYVQCLSDHSCILNPDRTPSLSDKRYSQLRWVNALTLKFYLRTIYADLERLNTSFPARVSNKAHYYKEEMQQNAKDSWQRHPYRIIIAAAVAAGVLGTIAYKTKLHKKVKAAFQSIKDKIFAKKTENIPATA
jgi:hypothetical protein